MRDFGNERGLVHPRPGTGGFDPASWILMPLPRFSSDAAPGEVLLGVGFWLADELGDGWAFLRSSTTLKRRIAGYTHEIWFQGSRWNRTGELIEVGAYAHVSSKALAVWRTSHADTVTGQGGGVYGSSVERLLEDMGLPSHRFDLTSEGTRSRELPRLRATVVEIVNPYLMRSLEPARFLERAPNGALGGAAFSLLEWLLSEGLEDQAQLLLDRNMNTPAAAGVIRGAELADEGLRRKGANLAEDLGWVARRWGLSIPSIDTVAKEHLQPIERGPELDASGYIQARSDSSARWSVTSHGGGSGQALFEKATLESALWSYGEDDLVARVAAGLPRGDVEKIGQRCAELEITTNPAKSDGSGYPFDTALALAAVEVLEGARRPLARKRRRSR